MVLHIKTFANQKPCTFFKALGHPLIASRLESFKKEGFSAVYDPEGHLDDFLALTHLSPPSQVYVQAIEALRPGASLVTKIKEDNPKKLLILSFEPEKHVMQMGPFLSSSCEILSLKELRLPESMLTDHTQYLSELNFSTNFAFFREDGGWHTHIKTANYWAKYGSQDTKLWAILFDAEGKQLAEWQENLPPTVHSVEIKSEEIKKRFQLPDFTGQLFIHITGTKGHSIVKYALDTIHDNGMISATHDANAWPSEYFAGLPAPCEGEKVILWLQNSHSIAVPATDVTLNLMGDSNHVALDRDIPPFGTYAVDVGAVFPKVKWPRQIEIHGGHYFVRPRYEVINKQGYRCIAHVNIERMDLKTDVKLKELTPFFGKGFILSAPVLPMDQYITSLLPTPMSRALQFMPLEALIYDKEGLLKKAVSLGNLPRNHTTSLTINDVVDLSHNYGHVELVYDFKAGDEADGWLHGLFRYTHKSLPAQAETSFGSHIFNTIITYKNEPQSYKGPPPGLTTGLFLRINDDIETFCHLIYPASTSWHDVSDTKLFLYTKDGKAIAESSLKIPQSGSRYWVYQDTFSPKDREKARGGYVLIQDKTCRLFGYHGLRLKNGGFSLDHMFGF